jgi:hypothetical protein
VLWASDLTKMNDPTELVHGPQILAELYRSIFPNSKVDLSRKSSLPNNGYMHLACSMSKVGDLLSQWRAYSNDGTGFSIGADQEDLVITNLYNGKSGRTIKGYEREGVPDFEIAEIFYSKQEFKEYYRNKMEEFKSNYGTPYEKDKNGLRTSDMFFVSDIYSAGCLLKSDFYKEEQEVRVFKAFAIDYPSFVNHPDIQRLDYRATPTGIKAFTNVNLTGNNICSIKQVILGPKNDSSIEDVQTFLKINKLDDIEVIKSKGEYR